MILTQKYISTVSTILFLSSLSNITQSMEKEGAGKSNDGPPKIDLLRLATAGTSANLRTELRSPDKKVPPHPATLSHDELFHIFNRTSRTPKESNDLGIMKADREMHVLIAGKPVVVFAEHKSHHDLLMRKLLKTSQRRLMGKFEKYFNNEPERGDNTLAIKGDTSIDSQCIAGFRIYYDGTNDIVIFDLPPEDNRPVQYMRVPIIYIAFASKQEDLPTIKVVGPLESPTVVTPAAVATSAATATSTPPAALSPRNISTEAEKKEKEKEKETKQTLSAREDAELRLVQTPPRRGVHKKKTYQRPTNESPLEKFKNKNLRRLFNPQNAPGATVRFKEGKPNKYKVTIKDAGQRDAIIKLLNSPEGDKYVAVLTSIPGGPSISQTLGTSGKQKQECQYTLMKEVAVIFHKKATAPKDAQLSDPKAFPTFTVSFYTD